MRYLLRLVSFFMSVALAAGADVALEHNQGKVSVPTGFIYDAHPGGALRPKDARNGIFRKNKFRIDFESGKTCGKAVDVMEEYWKKGKTATILQRRDANLAGQTVSMLIVKSLLDGKGGRSVIVSYPESKIDFTCEFADEGDLADFLFIAFSYRPNKKPAEQAVAPNGP